MSSLINWKCCNEFQNISWACINCGHCKCGTKLNINQQCKKCKPEYIAAIKLYVLNNQIFWNCCGDLHTISWACYKCGYCKCGANLKDNKQCEKCKPNYDAAILR